MCYCTMLSSIHRRREHPAAIVGRIAQAAFENAPCTRLLRCQSYWDTALSGSALGHANRQLGPAKSCRENSNIRNSVRTPTAAAAPHDVQRQFTWAWPWPVAATSGIPLLGNSHRAIRRTIWDTADLGKLTVDSAIWTWTDPWRKNECVLTYDTKHQEISDQRVDYRCFFIRFLRCCCIQAYVSWRLISMSDEIRCLCTTWTIIYAMWFV